MPYNGASNGSGGVGGAVAGSSVSGGGATIVVSEGPQNKKIRTGVQAGDNDVTMHSRSTQNQSQQQALLNKSNDDLRRKRPETTRPNHILLFTIINPFYPITVDVLHKICNPHGQVLRIVIFKKNGVQAMVEFDSLDAATRARENLNGADIYAGCCTLKIDFAKPEKLNVYKNETDTSWDYTLSTGEIQPSKSLFSIPENVVVLESQPPLLGPGTAFPPFGAPEYHPTQPDNWKGAAIHPTGLMKEPTGVVAGRNAPVAFAQQGQAQGAVMMVYGMDHDTSNTDKLFNLVCLYGNVARVSSPSINLLNI
ncbi:PREDICTED: heterogeneous nuclear ribonucleoprotein L isoform X11 [Drosophila arizonae]|uniref:Heterogeneous nuclear ribonucleoprotein L isoform X11 n=1 Tax=Drosophila arizonae TaxID=7263 RepID=A0ABM1PJU2_DROAR|nr:PREDICTED: heterogeneous nuclear ribonucleoprotein L isoform X11 [Drosophila arizonae]